MARDMPEYVTLDGYRVERFTDAAIGVAKVSILPSPKLTWIPRSQCRDGHRLDRGDTDIEVVEWLAEREGLDW